MRKNLLIILLIISTSLSGYTQSNAISFTLDDRDRIIRTEQEISSLRNEMNSLRNEMDANISAVDQKVETLYWGFGIMITLMLFLFGYIIWDRRTAMQPVKEKTDSATEKIRIIESILKEEAKTNRQLAGILRSYGLL